MKTPINISVEKDLLANAEEYALQHHLSLSQLIESFFKQLSIPTKQKNVIQLVRELNKPEIEENRDLIQDYYKEQKHKHGI